MSTPLNCPKCGAEMRSYERNEVTVDQCTGCGGLFLDRGELERLAAAESAYYAPPAGGQAPPPPQQQAPPQQAAPQHAPQQQHNQGYDNRYSGKPRKSKKRSFLEEFFE